MERQALQSNMSIKQHIHDLETAINDLKSNDLPIEDQITLYQQTIKNAAQLHEKINKISESIQKTSPTKHEL